MTQLSITRWIRKTRIRVSAGGERFTLEVEDASGKTTVGVLELDEIDGRMWVTSIDVTPGWRRRGHARKLVMKAHDYWGDPIYFSTQHKGDGTDDRYLTTDGRALAEKLHDGVRVIYCHPNSLRAR